MKSIIRIPPALNPVNCASQTNLFPPLNETGPIHPHPQCGEEGDGRIGLPSTFEMPEKGRQVFSAYPNDQKRTHKNTRYKVDTSTRVNTVANSNPKMIVIAIDCQVGPPPHTSVRWRF